MNEILKEFEGWVEQRELMLKAPGNDVKYRKKMLRAKWEQETFAARLAALAKKRKTL